MQNDTSSEEIIYHYILQQVISKQLFPGCRIIEEQLASDTGISRTPIRAALKRLNYEGLITIFPHKGSFLVNPTYDEMRDAYSCRILLETEIARLACTNITSSELKRLDELIDEEIHSHDTRNMQEFIRVNNEFHQILARASHNRYYEKYSTELNNKCNVYLLFFDQFPLTNTEDSRALHEHKTIVEMIHKRDVQGCVEAAKRHNLITLDELKRDMI